MEVHSEDGITIFQFLAGRDFAKDVRTNQIHQFAYQMANYVYLIATDSILPNFSKDVTLIDCCWDIDSIFALCAANKWNIVHSLYTHRHFDHVGGFLPKKYTQGVEIYAPGVAEFIKRQIKVYVGKADIEAAASQNRVPIESLLPLADELKFNIGKRCLELRTLHTPGHTPGSFCFLLDDRFLFTGDTLFIGSCGRFDLPESSRTDLMLSLRRLGHLPEKVLVYPGHNYAPENVSTIEKERQLNSSLRQALTASVSSSPTSFSISNFISVAEILLETSSNGHL